MVSGEAFDSRQHLVGRATGEREQENTFRRHPAFDQRGNAMHQRSRLTGSGTSDEQ